MVAEALILDKVYPENDFNRLIQQAQRQVNNLNYNADFGRFGITYGGNDRKEGVYSNWIRHYRNLIVPLAREVFDSPELDASYSMFAEYRKVNDTIPNLPKHKDDNACTYTIDVCLYYDTNWAIWIEGKEYYLEPNQAIVIYGEEQEHWRNEFPDPDNNRVGMMFNHYVEPDHWWNDPTHSNTKRWMGM